MYHHLRGRLVEKNPTYVVVECGGVGYMVHISLTTYSGLPEEENCMLYTSFIVREDAQLLYGFGTKKEREIFELLISVSGVGANTARLILSSLTPTEVIEAISSENVALLQSVKGIGAKSAQRIIIDLKGKVLKTLGGEETETLKKDVSSVRNEASQALEVLGFNRSRIDKIVSKLLSSNAELSVEEIIKQALNQL
ncbi:MAG: Holliday junction branch migration protein RuvA [Schleiferiaceae bacterium]|jgi:Holliday junction DNA helicase RuvA|nr:Holliday junction branch migration protein RuvA [Schleiferiaceae bacterium]